MKKFVQNIIMVLTVVVSVLGLSACHSDDPEPTPQPIGTMPAKVEITIYEGHLHGEVTFHQNTYPKECRYFGITQKFVFHMRDGKWVPDASNPKQFLGMSLYLRYAFMINYYDEAGNLINGRFIDNGQDVHYQHFFLAEDIEPLPDFDASKDSQEETGLASYTYVDTTPWDRTMRYDGAEYTGKNNPLGFKGMFEFGNCRQKFNLKIRLMEAKNSKFVATDEAGNAVASPFNAPTAEQLKNELWYPDIVIPAVIYISQNEKGVSTDEVDFERTVTEDTCSPEALRTIKTMMSVLGISFQEAVDELYYNENGDSDPEGASFWF